MNWKLIILLSFFGIIMALVNVYYPLPIKLENLIWVLIFIFYAFIIINYVHKRHFLHAFLINIINGFWLTLVPELLFSTYIENNPRMIANYIGLNYIENPHIAIVFMGPVIGALMGLFSGIIVLVFLNLKKKIN